MKDKQGRRYAILSEIKVGQYIRVDGDFSCMKPWTTKKVFRDDEGLYVLCRNGRHHLDGQCDSRGNLVGIYETESADVQL